MKPIEQTGHAIYNLLSNDADVMAIVEGKIRPDVAAQSDVAPYVVYSTSGKPIQTKDGTNQTAQVMCNIKMYSADRAELMDLAAKVRAVLDNRSGIYNNVDVQFMSFDDEHGTFEEFGPLEGLYSHEHDYEMWVNASTVPVNQMITKAIVKNTGDEVLYESNITSGTTAELTAPDATLLLNDADFISAKSGKPQPLLLVDGVGNPVVDFTTISNTIKINGYLAGFPFTIPFNLS